MAALGGTRAGGFVYVVEDDRGRSKVGRAKAPRGRRSELQVGNADRLKIAFSIRCASPSFVEDRAHEMLAPLLVRGEWFACRALVAAVVLQHVVTGKPSLSSVATVVAYFALKRQPFCEVTWRTIEQTLLAKMTLDPEIDEVELDRWAPLTLRPEEQVARFPVHVLPVVLGGKRALAGAARG